MNWLRLLQTILQLTPVVVAGVEHLHGDLPGSTKKQIAQEALSMAAPIASAIDPKDQATIQAAQQFTSQTIDGVVAVLNTAGVLGKKQPAPAQGASAGQ